MLKKILVANRGEIALRVIRACREMGIPTVAVYSSVDRAARHVQAADEAVFIGPPAPLESYLNIERIVQAALQMRADAIHPGYGFLAENPRFALRCEEAGLVFVGPSSKALALVGDKVESRKTASTIRVPLIPGMMAPGKSLEEFQAAAAEIGYPVLVKASGGGGGKGMHVVRSSAELKSSIEMSRREAKSAFGDDAVYIEKYLERPRHVEFQVLADRHGHTIHLCERECSIQRRHQKIVEETPSVALDPGLRRRMGETAVAIIRATGYTNAGTVEFLLDRERRFYFLEVNARIQVEHPITEMVVGVDLVKQQIRIAAGEPLTIHQEDIQQRGHAIECRIYAEDPERGFLPSPGRILLAREPEGPGIRCDSGIYSGIEVTPHYDPILSKLITWGEDRDSARQRMISALDRYVILGIPTGIEFLKDVIRHPAYASGDTHTHFVDEHFGDWRPVAPEEEAMKAALVAAALTELGPARASGPAQQLRRPTPWQTIGKWAIGGTR
ncbi:MAG: acetyl-CoA carboxylase biotin carboxylase subunit [Acidobacteriota bacterium]